MAKNKKNSTDNTYLAKLEKEQEAKKKKESGYINPARQLWGKIIIVVLGLSMVLGSIITLIYMIIENIRR